MSFSIFCRAARLASALASWRSPSTALKTVRPTSTSVVPDLAGDDLVHDRGAHEDDLHQVLVLAQERLQPRLRLLGGEDVAPVLRPSPFHLDRGQPRAGRRRDGWPPPPGAAGTKRATRPRGGFGTPVAVTTLRFGSRFSRQGARLNAAVFYTSGQSFGGLLLLGRGFGVSPGSTRGEAPPNSG